MPITYINGLDGGTVPSWLTPTIKEALDDCFDIESQQVPAADRTHYIRFYSNRSYAIMLYVVYFKDAKPTDWIFPINANSSMTVDPSPYQCKYAGIQYRKGAAVIGINGLPHWYPYENALGVYDATQIYIEDANVPFIMGDEPYDPTSQDEHIFTKDPDRYVMLAGTACTQGSTLSDYVYQTSAYSIKLRWTSQRTGTTYTMDLSDLTYTTTFITTLISGAHSFIYTQSPSTTAKATRGPAAGAYIDTDIPTAWSDLTDFRAVSEVPLQRLVDYMNTQDAGCTEQDVFTEIFADFYTGGTLVETKSCDYSSLYGDEDIDITGGTGVDPNGEPTKDDTNVYTDSIELTVPTLTGTGVFNRCYVLDGNSVNDLCDFLYNSNDSIFDEIVDGVLTRGNPIESLIDLRLYPFDVRAFTGAGTAQKIKFGRTETDVIGTKLPHNANAVISLGSAMVPREYISYLDYLTEVQLYIPFCGVCDLPIDRVLNHTISVKMIVDYITGACTAVVYVDQLPLLYRPGVIGISIPMTATNSAEFGKTIVGNLIKGAGELAAGNPSGAASLAGAAGKAYEGSHIQTVGASSPQTALYQPKNAYMLLSIAVPASGVYDPEYAQTVGYQCFLPVATIGYMSGKGYTVFDNVKINVPQATEAERSEILQLLTSGVFM